jgi:hypothetical protein
MELMPDPISKGLYDANIEVLLSLFRLFKFKYKHPGAKIIIFSNLV